MKGYLGIDVSKGYADFALMNDKLEKVEGDKRDKNVKTFVDTVSSIKKLGRQADKTLDKLIKAEESWFLATMMKFFK